MTRYTYSKVLSYFEKLEFFKGSKLDLRPIRALMKKLGNPQDRYKVVHITGTNGKGSVTAMCSAVLKEAGFKVGTYTSPHLTEITERVMINGRRISKSDFVSTFQEVKKRVDQLAEEGIDITWFEFMTAIALFYFAQKKVDYAVLEVGLGGRLDATNVVKCPVLSIITNIGFDHTHILGRSLEKIAKEKIAIIKPRTRVVTGERRKRLIQLIKQEAIRENAAFIDTSTFQTKIVSSSLTGQTIRIKTKRREYKVRISLLGHYQKYNTAVAVGAMESLNIAPHIIISGLRKAKWPGRMEVMQKKPLVVLDCAHNPDGMHQLAKSLRYLDYKRLILVLGISSGKDYKKMISIIAPYADSIITTQAKYRGLDAEVLADAVLANKKKAQVIPKVRKAVKYAIRNSGSKDLVLIAGSIFMVGEARTIWYRTEGRFLT